MPIRCLSFVEYGDTGWGWHLEEDRDPAWDDVRAAVRRLDKFRYPWVWLFIGDNDEDATIDCLTIMEGEGVYWVGLSAGKYDQLLCSTPTRAARRSTSGRATKAVGLRVPLDKRPRAGAADCEALWGDGRAAAGSDLGSIASEQGCSKRRTKSLQPARRLAACSASGGPAMSFICRVYIGYFDATEACHHGPIVPSKPLGPDQIGTSPSRLRRLVRHKATPDRLPHR